MEMSASEDIIALATGQSQAALAMIRLSGPNVIQIAGDICCQDFSEVPGHTLHFVGLKDEERLIDECLISIFHAPNSYTKENSVEISCHASPYIITEIIRLFRARGVRTGETRRIHLKSLSQRTV